MGQFKNTFSGHKIGTLEFLKTRLKEVSNGSFYGQIRHPETILWKSKVGVKFQFWIGKL